ncbi:MAG: Zn-ribbon domain-containing OB-fold protein [Candidatus Binataceae bacterium]|nr:Zn-ribbon domain-containing OB-fold protein [Candidatus Binataceae bacterium]
MAQEAQIVTDSGPRPIVPYLKLEPKPHLIGSKCACGAVYLDPKRVACSKCGASGPFPTVDLSERGKVYVFSVIHQSFPGIKTPYVTAIVDLPEGVSVRTNLLDVDPEQAQKEPHKIFGMPVEMVTQVASKDREGHDVIAFSFRPTRN